MGILKSREEFLPVTCAVLADEARNRFLSQVRKNAGGNDRIAKACGIPVSSVSDWASGKSLIPYHTLQLLSREFGVEAPQVSELRRELQAVVHVAVAAPRGAPPPPSKTKSPPRSRRESAPEPKPPRQKAPRRGRGSSSRSLPASKAAAGPEHKQAPKAHKPSRASSQKKKPQAAKPAPAGKGKLSTELAYWTGALLAGARHEGDTLRFSADRRIGQNFADRWAKLAKDLFGVEPVVSMSEDHKLQQAVIPASSLGDFLGKVEMKPESSPAQAPGAPRWAWSNPDWKKAFLKGVADSTAHFHRTPSLTFLALSPALGQSVQKILSSLGLAAAKKPDGSLVLAGKDAVTRYFETVGTSNLKLRDRFSAYQEGGSQGGSSQAEDDEEDSPGPQAAAQEPSAGGAAAPVPPEV
ncbi:MAG: helix-turn-helix transcriptional regulator [Elusimicrobiota bacterium]